MHIVREVKQVMDKNKELYNLHEVLDPIMGLSSQLKGLERFVDLSLKCVKEMGNQRPSMSEVVKELESIMTLVGLNPGSEPSSSTSASYEGCSPSPLAVTTGDQDLSMPSNDNSSGISTFNGLPSHPSSINQHTTSHISRNENLSASTSP
ncbi:hypothetical protein L1987_30593 [Smallanthus sonchifolius]|uniref:Uncharacterized protein n=1 Tax=Smallanthus sonchifolius TaxID=185202 RepID=A0ACB9I3Y0_9ASTR|nr:hypothetical protein L1987_30593 [Smallanthus sonchifolius]